MMSSKQTKRAKLTAKQWLFVHEYCIDTNATQAAKRAGYSPKTALIFVLRNIYVISTL